MSRELHGRRILVTQAGDFMGPVLCEVLAEHGADVIASRIPLAGPGAAEELVAASGAVDVLVAKLALPAPSTPAAEATDAEWRQVFAAPVDPLPRLVRAIVPAMTALGHGKILVIGSASALRGMRRASTYSAARSSPMRRPSASSRRRTTSRSTRSRRTSSTTQPTPRTKCSATRASRSA